MKTKDELFKEWNDIQIQSYETIQAPKVGRDKEADDWLISQYENSNKEKTLEQFQSDYQGYYVIHLAKEQDGVPIYKSFGQDENVFRGQFLAECKGLIGSHILGNAWETKLAKETLEFGNLLMSKATEKAKEHNLEHIKDLRNPPESAKEGSIESQLHILFSLSKWLIFYGKNGHGYEADY